MRYDWFKQFLINQFESVLRYSQILIRIRIRIQFLVIVYYAVMFYMLMMPMKFSFVPQHFFRFFFLEQDQDQESTSKINNKSYALCFKDTHQIWCRSAKFCSKSKSCSRWVSGSDSWFYFGFQYHTYISYVEDTHQILFGSANSFESYCVHTKVHECNDRHTDRQTDGKFVFCLFCLLRHAKHEHSSKGEIFFFTHAITIRYLFTYSVMRK